MRAFKPVLQAKGLQTCVETDARQFALLARERFDSASRQNLDGHPNMPE
jgi:hypothetical protein